MPPKSRGHSAFSYRCRLLTDRRACAPERFWTWTATDASGQVQPVLHAFASTEAGLAALAVAEGPATWASRVAALRPELSMDLDRALLSTWNDDPAVEVQC